MDTLGLHGLIAVGAIVIGVFLRFIVYRVLVNNSRWLPEKATKVANITSMAVIGVALVAIVANLMLNAHTPH